MKVTDSEPVLDANRKPQTADITVAMVWIRNDSLDSKMRFDVRYFRVNVLL